MSEPAAPTALERDQASWRLLQAQIRMAERQGRSEPWQAIAMILLAAAAIAAAGGIAGRLWPPQSQQITVHLDQPLVVKVEPK